MTRGAKWAGLSASVVVVVALVAGCTGSDPDPEPTPTTAVESPSPSASPSPEVTADALTPPARPPEMDQDDEAGAAAAARYFLELHLFALATGDLEEFDRLSATDCQFCANVRADVLRAYAAGGRFAPSALTVSSIQAGPRHPSLGGYPVRTELTIAGGAEYDAAGDVVAAGVTESGVIDVDVVFSVAGWTLVEVSGSES